MRQLLSTPKITTFLAKPLPKLRQTSASNTVPRLLSVNLLFIVFLTNLSSPNKQLYRVQLLAGLRGHVFNS